MKKHSDEIRSHPDSGEMSDKKDSSHFGVMQCVI